MTLEALRWRYAVKEYDTTRSVAAVELEPLLEAVRLAPSSFGLQPYRLVVVEDAALRGELRAASHGQAQITEALRRPASELVCRIGGAR